MRIISSLDAPFAIENLVNTVLCKAKESVEICVPWLDNGFVSLLKRTMSPNTALNLLVKTPQENDKTFCALRTLEGESIYKSDIVCVPWLHAKFLVVDSRDVIFGSANATSNAFYYNNEVLVGFNDMPEVAARFLQIFNQIKRQPSNLKWSIVREYSGCFSYSTPQLRIMKLVKRFFKENGNSEILLSLLVRFAQNSGYGFEIVKMTIQEMIKHGLLYEPHPGYIKLT